MPLGYFQKQQKADPPLECRGRCSSSSCTACLENNSRSYVIISGSPLVNVNAIQISRVGTLPTSSYGQCEETALHLLQSLLHESLKENSLAEQKFPTLQKETTYFTLKKEKKNCQRRWDTKICQPSQSLFHNYNGKVSLLGLNEEVQVLSDVNCLATPHLWSI